MNSPSNYCILAGGCPRGNLGKFIKRLGGVIEGALNTTSALSGLDSGKGKDGSIFDLYNETNKRAATLAYM